MDRINCKNPAELNGELPFFTVPGSRQFPRRKKFTSHDRYSVYRPIGIGNIISGRRQHTTIYESRCCRSAGLVLLAGISTHCLFSAAVTEIVRPIHVLTAVEGVHRFGSG